MILRYGASNFYSFKEGVEVSFELPPSYSKKTSSGHSVANLICVKGANGSGKTNVLRILAFLNHLCVNSFNVKPDEDILISSFFSNDDPINIYCDFTIEDTEYNYEVSLNKKSIISESITRKQKRPVLVFRREGNKITERINDFSDLDKIKLRSNASIVSTSHQYEIAGMAPIYTFFANIISNVIWSGRTALPNDFRAISKYYNDNSPCLNFAIDLIKKSDIGINNVSIINLKNENGETYYYPIFEHDTNVNVNRLTYFEQSSGTQELFNILPYYKFVLETGGVLALDEFDINLHPHILPLLIELFDNKESNPLNAQMIFTTHHEKIIDFMGKYRTILVNKEKSESFAYRLDEIPGDLLRNDRQISPIYNSGKIGGVPRV